MRGNPVQTLGLFEIENHNTLKNLWFLDFSMGGDVFGMNHAKQSALLVSMSRYVESAGWSTGY